MSSWAHPKASVMLNAVGKYNDVKEKGEEGEEEDTIPKS
jgi:hypothetical protein